ncbi:MAG TPA: crosslink repair DNA glycosylase YcaQ family protein [Polyangiaceae bacterium]|nr:crosslink repair DNA glycosylase YcaQ family protein [Polyangiaceae bacterium]
MPSPSSTNLSRPQLRRFAVARTLFAKTTLRRALSRLGFVQADPLRAPARAQDLILRHRVTGYRAGDLERLYPKLPFEESFFINYGYLPRGVHERMCPRVPTRAPWTAERRAQANAVLAFVNERGVVHPREVDARFAHGKVTNWFGGSSNASTKLLEEMHYRGLLRVERRVGGVRTFAAAPATSDAESPEAAMDGLLDVAIRTYAPLPGALLGRLASQLRFGAPQWSDLRAGALARAKKRLARAEVEGVTWYWPSDEGIPVGREAALPQDDESVRLLAPFDPLVWDRARFELLWGWSYRFEAYTPAAKRIRGYYALPLLWRDQVIGWGNLKVHEGELHAELGYVAGQAPRSGVFRRGLEAELARMRAFLLTPRRATTAPSA